MWYVDRVCNKRNLADHLSFVVSEHKRAGLCPADVFTRGARSAKQAGDGDGDGSGVQNRPSNTLHMCVPNTAPHS
jgi:hypothetical protein